MRCSGLPRRSTPPDPWQFECRLSPLSHYHFAPAANGRNPPFTSKCAWCSNLTAPYLIIVTNGPRTKPLSRQLRVLLLFYLLI